MATSQRTGERDKSSAWIESGRKGPGASCGHARRVRTNITAEPTMNTAPSATKELRHPAQSVKRPPKSGPSVWPKIEPAMKRATVACRSSSGTTSPMYAMPSATGAEAKIAMRKRAAASELTSHAAAQASEAAPASAVPMVTTRSLPKRSPSGPCSSTAAA